MTNEFQVIIVGAGFFGATIAERIANDAGLSVLVVDKRPHYGGNCWTEVEPTTGIEYHVYGTHIFHTSNEDVWRYVQRFGEFTEYRHRVLTIHGGNVYTMPINLGTICTHYQRYFTPDGARQLIAREIQKAKITNPSNLEEKAISLIGAPLYEALIKGYTRKQWETDPSNLPPHIITRLPVRFDFNDRYFSDTFEGMPHQGYSAIFKKMLSNPKIEVRLNTDFFSIRDTIEPGKLIIYTGPVDRFFNFRCGNLGWRTLDFERAVVPVKDFQGTSVMNYADTDIPYTRIHEFKHLHPERKYTTESTFIAKEYSRRATERDEPYYPIGTATDRSVYSSYRQLAAEQSSVLFGGRLGTYRYIDMHQAIAAALKAYDSKVLPFIRGERTMLSDPALED